MAKAPINALSKVLLSGTAGSGKTSGRKGSTKKPAAKKPYTQEKLDKARKTVSKSDKDVYLISGYMGLTLQELRDKVDEEIKKYGSDAVYDLDIEIGYGGYYDERHIEIEQKITTSRLETDAEVTERLDKNTEIRVARAATKKAAKEAQEQDDRDEYARLQKLFGEGG